jgi:hypothetical protein
MRESYAYQALATRLRIVSDAINLVGAFLPSGTLRWFNGYARDPAWFLLWAGIIAFLIWYGSTLKSEVNSRMRRIWNTHVSGILGAQTPSGDGMLWKGAWWTFLAALTYLAAYSVFDDLSLSFLKLGDPWNSLIQTYTQQPVWFVLCLFLAINFLPERTVQRLRTWVWYQRALWSIKYTVAPAVFAILIVYGALALLNHLLFNVRDSF